jgi:hypothetical protein
VDERHEEMTFDEIVRSGIVVEPDSANREQASVFSGQGVEVLYMLEDLVGTNEVERLVFEVGATVGSNEAE